MHSFLHLEAPSTTGRLSQIGFLSAPAPQQGFSSCSPVCQRRNKRLRRINAAASDSNSHATKITTAQPPAIDPYSAAARRLESLLSGVGNGEEELLNSMLMTESVNAKLGTALIAGSAVSAVAYCICRVAGTDFLGGASLSLGTLHAAAIGGVAAIPLVIAKAALWSEKARSYLPFLEDVQSEDFEEYEPLLFGLSPLQMLAILGAEVIPSVLVLLPAAIGGITKALEECSTIVGIEADSSVASLLAVSSAAVLVAISKGLNMLPDDEQFRVVQDAMQNAERYYRVVGLGGSSSGSVDNAASSRKAAGAFQAVAATWLARKELAARFSAAFAACECLFLGCLWRETGDLAAPMVAALAAAAVDFAAIRQRMPVKYTSGPSGSSKDPTAP